ncbi:hypothetical protein Bhyg_08359 [Pseudolycoriella hygida]|uniref:Uncharacterized protein n=1 Tax=Pseudolycoriella hygida TaxID=35572 RepID=A0A9Q0N4F9_9DIPT|nr:hypothetical protein Bhyg_08359 [Pseudolycoriella hygida]
MLTMKDENVLIRRFNTDTSRQIQNHYENAPANCKVLLCMMTMYAVLSEGEPYFPQSPFINDAAFVNVIRGSNLVECDNNKSIYNIKEVVDGYRTTTEDKSFTTDRTSTIDFNHLENASQQDAQSTKSNEIEGSFNESKHEPKSGFIDIFYTNENYTNAAAIANGMNDEVDMKLEEDNKTIGGVDDETTDSSDVNIYETTPPFVDYFVHQHFM